MADYIGGGEDETDSTPCYGNVPGYITLFSDRDGTGSPTGYYTFQVKQNKEEKHPPHGRNGKDAKAIGNQVFMNDTTVTAHALRNEFGVAFLSGGKDEDWFHVDSVTEVVRRFKDVIEQVKRVEESARKSTNGN